MCLAVLRPHGQGRHEARQSYGLELPSLEVICPRWRRQLGIQLAMPALPKRRSLASSFLKARSIYFAMGARLYTCVSI